MKNYNKPLSRQLLSIAIIIFSVIFISLGILLPKALVPIYEKNIYRYLKEPLILIQNNLDRDTLETDIAYLYIIKNEQIIHSDNLNKVIKASPRTILKKIDNSYGKIKYLGKEYYYNTSYDDSVIKVAITGDAYIKQIKNDILFAILPILLVTLILVLGLILLWSRKIVMKISHLKNKIVNIDNDNYIDTYKYETDDEIQALSTAIDNMKNYLRENEKYKSQMYQNISHDFKTPLTVIKSYVEAVQDGVEDENTALKVIGEQTNKLEQKVHSLLYLNKLDYLKDSKDIKVVAVDMKKILEDEISKFKFQKKDIKFILDMDKRSKYYGTVEHWETILDNLLGNFMRYANTTIKIIAKNNKIILFNDGDNIDDDLLNGIFTPFRKGIKGQFGLGLSIAKKSVSLLGYEITVRNEKKGISFIIK